MFDTFWKNAAACAPLGATHDAWRWIDGSSAAMQAWMELQQALWQPWWDLQAEWLRQWGVAMNLPPELTARGAEQLG
jgi:hypothetical protein